MQYKEKTKEAKNKTEKAKAEQVPRLDPSLAWHDAGTEIANSIDTTSFDDMMSGSSYDVIQNQMSAIQKLLPKIKDVSKRAGIVSDIAPDLEKRMKVIETKMKEGRSHGNKLEKSEHDKIMGLADNIVKVKGKKRGGESKTTKGDQSSLET